MTCFDARAYWEGRLARHFDIRGAGYIDLGRPYNEWLYRLRQRVFGRLVRSCGTDFASAEVLDLGCGTGFYVDCWAKLGVRKITGVDLTATAVTRLAERYPQYRFYRADVGEDLAWLGPGRFDAVSCMDVLFHVVDDAAYARALQNIRALLKPGGIALLSNHFVHGKARRPTPHVVCRPLVVEMAALHEAGLEVLARRPMFVLMNAPVDSDNRLLWSLWRMLERAVSRRPAVGFWAGGALYPLERVLVRLCRESPTTEILLCRRPAA